MFCRLGRRTAFSTLPGIPTRHFWMLLTQAKRWPRFTKMFLTSFLLRWSLRKNTPTSPSTSDGVCNCSRLLERLLLSASVTLATMEFMNSRRTLTQTRGASVLFRRDGVMMQSQTARPIRDSAPSQNLIPKRFPTITDWWFPASIAYTAGARDCSKPTTHGAMLLMKYRTAALLPFQIGPGCHFQYFRWTQTTCVDLTDPRITMSAI